MNLLKNLFTVDYMFTVKAVLGRSDKLFVLLGGIALILAIVMKIAAATAPTPVDKTYRQKFFNLLLTLGLWELVWFACRYEEARFFGSHFMAWLGFLVAAIWLIYLVIEMAKNYSSAKQSWEKEQVRLKYLPR